MLVKHDETSMEVSYSNFSYKVVGDYAFLQVEGNNVSLDDSYSVTFADNPSIPEIARGRTYTLYESRRYTGGIYAILKHTATTEPDPEA